MPVQARVGWLLSCMFLLAAFSPAQQIPDAELDQRIDAYIRSFIDTGNFSGAVLVGRAGKVIFRRAYGMANYELQVPNSPEIRFHIASVSKPFTAAAILQLQEQGKLHISDKVSAYLPDFPHGNEITLDNLLTHTSGLPNINDLPDYDTFARSPHSVQELVAKFAGLPLEFEPGSDYQYSNSNYNLLAWILEKVSGQGYGQYLHEHIFLPAGMAQSGHDGDALDLVPLSASGYQPAGKDGYENAPYLDWSNKTGNGSLYSTLDDLWRFDRALGSDKILKPATRAKYYVEGRGNRYGWFNRKSLGHRVMSSNGRSPGFTAELDRFIDDGVTIIVLSNSYATVSQEPIAKGIAAICFGQQPETPAMEPVSISQAKLKSFAGDYQFGPEYFVPNAKAKLTTGSGYLLLQIADFRTPLVPLASGEFLERNFFGHVSFPANAITATQFVYHYAGREFVAHRLSSK